MRHFKAIVGLVPLLLLATSDLTTGSPSSAPSEETVLYSMTTQPAADAEATLAIVGGSSITGAEIQRAIAPKLRQLEHQRYELLEKAVDRAIERRLLEVEARTRGISADELLELEVEARLHEPSDAELDAYYQANKSHIDGSKAEVAPQLRRYLIGRQRQRREAELVTTLRAKHGVQVFLGPFRTRVETGGFPSKGPEDAPVTIVAFSDFDCVACAHLEPTLDQIMTDYGDKIRLVFRQFPLASHPNAQAAAAASLCAYEQDLFWEMHDVLREESTKLDRQELQKNAKRLGLDVVRFGNCLASTEITARVQADVEAGSEAGVYTPPALFINGRFLTGSPPYERLARIIDDELSRTAPSNQYPPKAH
jgi:protein-disulfide isomerase